MYLGLFFVYVKLLLDFSRVIIIDNGRLIFG